ncbi:MAG: aminoglycoside phosphotransferase [Wenzhouxiangella sp.]|nr:MAG: aminoglycoside phosphotransferase [Wenzhouxiangella sp.]
MSAPTRREEALEWALGQLGWTQWSSKTVSSDASFRSYYRIGSGADRFIIMDAPPEHEPVQPFLDIGARLRTAGLHAPRVLAADPARGFLLLEDLGSRPYHLVLDPANADELFDDALQALRVMQSRVETEGLPAYDAARLLQELALFPDWFLRCHWRIEPTDAELDDWDLLCALLIRWALDQAQVFCHRDYMPRNLMVSTPNPGIIDFQDAVLGPISYDPVCLFRDAFLSWPSERVDAWLESYRVRGLAAGLPLPESSDLWRRTCDLMGVQRHLKVIGIFARIRYRDRKPEYLDDVPRFFAYLDAAIARNPELAPLERLIAAWKGRRQLAQ